MAYINSQDDEMQNPQGLPGQAPQVGGGSNIVGGGGASSAGVGAGGSGGFTNIQAYLKANQGDTGSAGALNKTVGSQFGQERSAMQGDSSQFLQGAKSQVDANKINNDQADDYLGKATSQYEYPGSAPKGGGTVGGQYPGTPYMQKVTPHQDVAGSSPVAEPGAGDNSYQDIVSKFQKSLNDPYSGPKDYNYGMNAQTQQYGSDLKDDGGFDKLMNSVYSNSAQRPLTSGQFQLQKQFDVNSQPLADTRKSLAGQYDQLGTDRNKIVGDTTSALGGYEQDYRTNQNQLRDYLSGKSNDFDSKLNDQESAARAGYDTELNSGSGKSSAGWDGMTSLNDLVHQYERSGREGSGIFGDNLSYKQLQREQDQYKQNSGVDDAQNNYMWHDSNPDDIKARGSQLNDFYTAEDNKYAGTGDAEKRSYNVLQDFLNSGAAKKDRKFNVRG